MCPGYKPFGNCVLGTISRVPCSGSETVFRVPKVSCSVRASNPRSEVYVFTGCQSGSSVCLYQGFVLVFVGSFTVSVSKLVLSLDVFSRLSVYRVSSI